MRYQITYEHRDFDSVTRKREWRSYTLRPTCDARGSLTTADNLRLNRDVRNVVRHELADT
jgi:hypothetical protein